MWVKFLSCKENPLCVCVHETRRTILGCTLCLLQTPMILTELGVDSDINHAILFQMCSLLYFYVHIREKIYKLPIQLFRIFWANCFWLGYWHYRRHMLSWLCTQAFQSDRLDLKSWLPCLLAVWTSNCCFSLLSLSFCIYEMGQTAML